MKTENLFLYLILGIILVFLAVVFHTNIPMPYPILWYIIEILAILSIFFGGLAVIFGIEERNEEGEGK